MKVPKKKAIRRVVHRNRLIAKDGYVNVRFINPPDESSFWDYFSFDDVYAKLIETRWRFLILIYIVSQFTTWSVFATLYWSQAHMHGDFLDHGDYNWTKCIENAEKFVDYFIFSFATQSTVGFGYRHLTSECPMTICTAMSQMLFGGLTLGLLTGFVISKMARPINRNNTLIFSKNAVILKRNGKLCLMIRLGDMKKTCLAEAHVRMQLISKKFTTEGELLSFHQSEMDVGYSTGNDRLIVMWPMTVVHEINELSPLYEVSKASLRDPRTRFEIVVTLEGVVEHTGSTTQARTSYLPNEILWGKNFELIATYHRSNGIYIADLNKFDCVHDAPNTPSCSAKELDEMIANGTYKETKLNEEDQNSLMNQTTINDAKEFFTRNSFFGRRKKVSPIYNDNSDVEQGYSSAGTEDTDDEPMTLPSAPHPSMRREFDMF